MGADDRPPGEGGDPMRPSTEVYAAELAREILPTLVAEAQRVLADNPRLARVELTVPDTWGLEPDCDVEVPLAVIVGCRCHRCGGRVRVLRGQDAGWKGD